MNRSRARITSEDVAVEAGVSQTTVSRVLQADPRVRTETRDRVLEACVRLNYAPNALARAMRSGGTGVIGVVVADIRNPFYSEAIEAFSTAANKAGRSAVIWNADSDDAALRATQERLIDGLIFTTALPHSPMLREALKNQTPLVLFNRGLSGVDCDQVISANSASGRSGAQYLIQHGRVDLAVVHGSSDISTTEDRAAGFADGARELGVPCRSVRTGIGREAGVAAAQELLTTGARPDSVFCTTDICAAGFIDGARSLGVRVPEDVWVIGFDGIPLADWAPYSLTTFVQPLPEMVRQSMDLLSKRIADPSRDSLKVVLDNQLVVRQSTSGKPLESGRSVVS